MFEKAFAAFCVSLILGFVAMLEGKRNQNRIERNAKKKGISISQALEEEELRKKKLARNMRIFMFVCFLALIILIIVISNMYDK